MLYFPLRKTKIHLIILFALIMINVSFETVFKKETINNLPVVGISSRGGGYPINSPLRVVKYEIDFLNIKLPEETAILIYLGYFIVVTRIILSAKVIKKDSDDEE